MAHSIRAIIVGPATLAGMRGALPGVLPAPLRQGFVAFPIEADFVDALVAPGPATCDDDAGFQLLTGPFRDFLRQLSRLGPLAYVETDYFGGVGEQGAGVFADGTTLMEPEWGRRGLIERALKRIGVRRGPIGMRHLSPKGRRVRWLGGMLGGLTLLVAARGIVQSLPREPRIYLVHAGGEPDAVRSECGDVALPPLKYGEWVRLNLTPRPGCRYTVDHIAIAGDELVRLMGHARGEKADLEIVVGFDSVHVAFTRRYGWW